MTKKKSIVEFNNKQIENLVRATLYSVLLAPGFFIAFTYWLGAAFSLCGISGCSGGGFGVSYSPSSVQHSLIVSGLVSAIAPFIIFFISKFKWWWIVITILTIVLVPIAGALYIGAGLDGYPIHRLY